jgi:UMF1 family MFS transporter
MSSLTVGHDASEPLISTKSERRGWYMYDFANGAYFYTTMNLLPVLIQEQASEIAKKSFCEKAENLAMLTTEFGEDITEAACVDDELWAQDFENIGTCYGAETGDWAGCADAGSFTNTTCVAEDAAIWAADWRDEAIFVPFLGFSIGYASVPFICTIISVFLQIIFFLSFGALADYGNLRKKLLILANTVGAGCVILVYFGEDDEKYVQNSILWIIGNLFFTFAIVFYNAYLPLLTLAHPDVVAYKATGPSNEDFLKKVDSQSSEISNKGLAMGFFGSLLNLFFSVAVLFAFADGNQGVRIVIAFSGVWALAFGGYSFSKLGARPGHALPAGETYLGTSRKNMTKVWNTRHELPQLFRFLAAYFIFSDGTSTMTGATAIFAAIELKMESFAILSGIVLVLICGIASCFLWMKIEKAYELEPKDILMNLLILGCLPIYAFFGVKCRAEFYLLCLIFGLNFGSYTAYTRTVYATHVPRGHEAEFFSLFEITDKGSAWLGPLLVSIIFDATGSFRDSFFSLAGFLFVGAAILYTFDPTQAKVEKEIFEKKEKDELAVIKSDAQFC